MAQENVSQEQKGSEKAINKSIKSIVTTGAKLSKLIHETGVRAMDHAREFKDARPMLRLYLALPNGVRKEGFKLWVHMFSPIRINGDEKIQLQKEGSDKYTPFDVSSAAATPFWDATKENETKPLAPDFLKKLIDREVAKIMSADDQGNIRDKEGNVRFHLEGNVVEMKEYAQKIKAAA